MQFWVLVSALLFVIPALGRISDGQVRVKLQDRKIIAQTNPGFHFNVQAPAGLIADSSEEKPIKKEEAELIFPGPGGKGSFKISFWVCDDKKTVCEDHVYDFQVKRGKLIAATPKAPSAEKTNKITAKKSIKPSALEYNSHGFIVNNLEGALAKAKRENKLLFVDYGAPWCPACVRLETEVFDTPEFKRATQEVVKLMLVSDMLENKEFGDKYNIKVLPTMLVLNSAGEEIYRDINFRSAPELSADLSLQFQQKQSPWGQIEKQAKAGDKAAMSKMAAKALSTYDMGSALLWYQKLQEINPKYAFAEISWWSEKDLKDDKNRQGYIEVLKKWIAQDPKSYTAMMARNDWADQSEGKTLPEDLQKELKKNLEILKPLSTDPVAAKELFKTWGVYGISPYEQEEVYAQWLASAKALKDPKSQDIKAQFQTLLKSRPYDIHKPGEILEGLVYFRKAELVQEEGEWLRKLSEANPQTYVYHMKLAGYYVRQKDFAKALPEAQKAVDMSEDRRLQNLLQLAKIQSELKQKEEAKKTIARALALPEAKMSQYKSALGALEDLKKSL